MKKYLALLCAVILLLTTACAAPDRTQPTYSIPTNSTVTEPPVTDPPVTEPPVTQPPVTLPDPHELFDILACRPLRGTWSFPITLDGTLLYLPGFEESITFNLYYSFDKHGQFAAFFDEHAFNDALTGYENMIIEHMVQLQYLSFKGRYEYYNTPEEIDAMWADGAETQARVDSQDFVASLNLYHKCMKLVRQGEYYTADGKLYTQVDEGVFECNAFSVANGKLTLTNTDNLAGYRALGLSFPLTFTQI